MEKTIPPKLYKYQSLGPSSHTLDNLRECQVWASKPEDLNDPFDCAIPYVLSEISDEQWRDGFGQSMQRFWENNRNGAAMLRSKTRYLSNGVPNKVFKKDVVKISEDFIRGQLEKHKNNGVACFSEDFRSILMWSHYADGHKGLCLEFDIRYVPFDDPRKVLKVQYSSTYPSISPVDLLSLSEELTILPLTTKSISWEYEHEWRLITLKGNVPIAYDPRALSAIYLGCSMPNSDIRNIKAIVKHTGTRLYRMHTSKTEFKLEEKIYCG